MKLRKMLNLCLCLLLLWGLATGSAVMATSAPPRSEVVFTGTTTDEWEVDFQDGTAYSETDLFPSFKNVMPGDTLTETVTLKNEADGCDYIRVYLRAVPHGEDNDLTYNEVYENTDGKDQANVPGERDETVATMTDFLQQLTLTVTDVTDTANPKVISTGTADGEGLERNKFLVLLEKGQQAQLQLELEVPIEMGNEFANRVGEVDWVFTVEALTYQETNIVVQPIDMVTYMGGSYGYVPGANGTVSAEPGADMPWPIFRIETPEGVDPESLTFRNVTNNLVWGVSKVADGYYQIYSDVDEEGNQADRTYLRVAYLNDAEQWMGEQDLFDPSDIENMNETYITRLLAYTDENDKDTDNNKNTTKLRDIIAYVAPQDPEDLPLIYFVHGADGVLNVRYVQDDDGGNNPVSLVNDADLSDPVGDGQAVITAPDGTTYTLNNTGIPVQAPAGVGLLFDDIYDNAGHDRTRALQEHPANEKLLPTLPDGWDRNYQAKYLDLVNAYNGNAWVKASKPVTITWGYPEGTDENTQFTLLHYKGLHRDSSIVGEGGGYDVSEIAKSEVEEVSIRNTRNGIQFNIGSGGFSPFMLVWSTPPENMDITVEKVWKNKFFTSSHPEEAQVYLTYNGQRVDNTPVTLNKGNNWTYTWNVPYYATGYSVEEVPITNYKTDIGAPVYNRQLDRWEITVTNTYVKPPDLLQTGQLNWPIPVLCVLGVGMITLGVVLTRRKREEDRG